MLFNEENKIKPIKGLVLITSLLLLTILIRKDADKKYLGNRRHVSKLIGCIWIQEWQNIYHTNSILSTPFKRTTTISLSFFCYQSVVCGSSEIEFQRVSSSSFIRSTAPSSRFMSSFFPSLIHSWYVHKSPSVVYVLMHVFLELGVSHP